jgi:hypothetical protein
LAGSGYSRTIEHVVARGSRSDDMNRIASRGLAVALLAATLSVLGVGTSGAHSKAQPREGDNRDPVTKIVCQLQRNC